MRSSYEIYKDLKDQFPKLSDFELMKLSIEQERNDIFMHAFVGDGMTPSFLEAIAIQMGFTPRFGGTTILDAIENIGDKFPTEISVKLEE